MMQAQTAPAQFPAMQMPFGAPAAGAGWHRTTMDPMNMNRGMWPNDGSVATGGPATVGGGDTTAAVRATNDAVSTSAACVHAGGGSGQRCWGSGGYNHERGPECGGNARASGVTATPISSGGADRGAHVGVQIAARAHGRGRNRACGAGWGQNSNVDEGWR
jgi:hypothetical protein